MRMLVNQTRDVDKPGELKRIAGVEARATTKTQLPLAETSRTLEEEQSLSSGHVRSEVMGDRGDAE